MAVRAAVFATVSQGVVLFRFTYGTVTGSVLAQGDPIIERGQPGTSFHMYFVVAIVLRGFVNIITFAHHKRFYYESKV